MPIVMLIEDDPLVRVPLAHALDRAGYEVLAAADGREGLALLQGRSVDVAVIDVVLPGSIDGIGLMHEARRYDPALKVILTSGRPLPADAVGLTHFAPKPLRPDALITRVRRVIDGDELADDLDLWMTAQRVIDEFGKLAAFYAAFRANLWREHGDRDACRTWTRIEGAVEQLEAAQRPGGATAH